MISSTALSRPELGPPSIKLRTNLANVVVASLDGVTEDHRLEFRTIRDIHNEAPETFWVRSDERTASQLFIDGEYIVAYVAWTVTRKPSTVSKRVGGPVLINIPGAAPAIFRHSGRLEKMLSWDLVKTLESPSEMLPLLIEGIQSTDWQEQNFFVTELVTRERLHKELQQEDLESLFEVLTGPAGSPEVKQFLLTYGTFLNKQIPEDRLRQYLRQVLAQYPVELELLSSNPAFVRAVLTKMQTLGGPEDLPLLVRWLSNNHIGVAGGALKAINVVQPDYTDTAIRQALTQSMLNKKTRQMLTDELRRLQLAKNQTN